MTCVNYMQHVQKPGNNPCHHCQTERILKLEQELKSIKYTLGEILFILTEKKENKDDLSYRG